ncbi:hypothetical protein T11_6182 [Trichinella zimbabwensis]|uniref:HAT C-terminal dimerisation domain-containing protein n=1 Tax=Trichinella zimbabwensis TaxID=268475 RepID=A0A0V1H4J8_9BILA|nr:hypothetical protein T11_8296 [Trichinella zimbabwensis]KRZ05592.1 hypothetical protein T11_6182 [Trichinella zimbabwensis]
MIRINGSVTLSDNIQIILEKFKQFELDMKSDIVALVMDSAFVMKTIVHLLGIEHQLRYNHGIHLAVADDIYCVRHVREEFGADNGQSRQIEFYVGNVAKVFGDEALGQKCFERMFKILVDKTEDDDGNGDDSDKSDPDINKSIADQLDTLIRRRKYFKCDLIDSCPGKDIMKIIKNEMAVFEAVGQRPKTLQMLYDALITVPSTSWEAERSFSAAGLFVTKLRSSLKDETIDTLCLLRSYHMQI